MPHARPVEIFRSHSSIETEVVRGLLDAHGIEASVTSALSPSLFPVRFGQAEFRVSVPAAAAGTARDLIASHLDEAAATEIRRLTDTVGPLEDAARVQVSRHRPARACPHAPVARPRGRVRRRHRQRVARVPRRRRPGIRDRGHAVPALSDAQRRLQVESEGVDRLGDLVDPAGRKNRPRPLRAARPRRGEDRRPAEARDPCRQLRGRDRRDLSGRRHRARPRVHRVAVRSALDGRGRSGGRGLVHGGLEVGAAGTAAGGRARAAELPARLGRRARSPQAVRCRSAGRRSNPPPARRAARRRKPSSRPRRLHSRN